MLRAAFKTCLTAFLMAFLSNSIFCAEKIRIGLLRFPENFDPAQGFTYTDKVVRKALYRNLVSVSGTGKISADLAKWWSISQDRRIYTMCIERAFFHDGRLVEFEDIEYSVKRNQKIQFGRIQDNSLYTIQKLGPMPGHHLCFRFAFKLPNHEFLQTLGGVTTVIVPRDFNDQQPIGSGAYRLNNSRSPQHFSYEYMGKGHDSQPAVIEFTKVENDAQGLKYIDHGVIDVLLGIRDYQLVLKNNSHVKIHGLNVNAFVHLFVNAKSKMFLNPDFRRRFLTSTQMVIHDSQKSNQLLQNTKFFIPKGLLPFSYYRRPQETIESYSLSPWENSLKGEKIRLVSCLNELSDKTVANLRNLYRVLGADLVYEFNFSKYKERLERRDYHLLIGCVPGRTPTIQSYLYPLRPGKSHSFTNADLTSLLKPVFRDLQKHSEKDKRFSLAESIRALEQTYYFIPLFESKLAIPMSHRISLDLGRFTYGLNLSDFRRVKDEI